MMRVLHGFLALDGRRKWMLLQAWLLLGRMRAGIALMSFKTLARKLQQHPRPIDLSEPSSATMEKAHEVAWAVRAAAKRTPWDSACLVQALAAQRMLRKKVPGMLLLGVAKELQPDGQGLSAHAWLQCGREILIGAGGHERFTVVSVFSWGVQDG